MIHGGESGQFQVPCIPHHWGPDLRTAYWLWERQETVSPQTLEISTPGTGSLTGGYGNSTKQGHKALLRRMLRTLIILYIVLLSSCKYFSFFILLSLSLCRNGKQIDFLSIDENYNFELQQFISLGSIKTIKQVVPYCLHYHTVCCAQNYLILTMLYATLQGDEIAVECTYSTSNRMTATMVGKYYMTCYYTCRNTNHRT